MGKTDRLVSWPAFTAMTILLVGSRFASGAVFTLSQDGLMALDSSWLYAGTVIERHPSGNGVEFSIRFASNQNPDNAVTWLSMADRGNKTLAGINVSAYGSFALTFSLVSVTAGSTPITGVPLLVGASVNSTTSSLVFQPVRLGQLLSGYPTTNTSTTTTTFGTITHVGFIAYQDPAGTHLWPSGECVVKLLVKPTVGAMAIPEPGSLLLLGSVSLLLRRNRPLFTELYIFRMV